MTCDKHRRKEKLVKIEIYEEDALKIASIKKYYQEPMAEVIHRFWAMRK